MCVHWFAHGCTSTTWARADVAHANNAVKYFASFLLNFYISRYVTRGNFSLKTCVETMTNAKHCKLQWGITPSENVFATCNAPTGNDQLFFLPLLFWNLPRDAKYALWLARCHKIALEVAMDMSQAANCLAALRKVEDSSTFLATYNAKFLLYCRL